LREGRQVLNLLLLLLLLLFRKWINMKKKDNVDISKSYVKFITELVKICLEK
jgi:hypothetical protein